ncbi:DUF2589 domain-containing protein [Bacteroides sp. 14(A)]|uniref:DUF2589 domain-containing protein n=1 Tax=Bacteroides sp. 14(A) TaxID=1163670 RepID=UPI0004785A1B|nr:DUF2589 domain-containing protein [Bacteroides sp. 14(A)]
MNTDNKIEKRQSSQVMELKDLISGPLVATIDADTISARRYLNYLYELAFESYNPQTGEVGNLRNLQLKYKCMDSGVMKEQKVSIPLLTLVPLPLLQVKEADFDFDIQIIDALSADRNATFSLTNKQDEEVKTNDGVKLRVTMAPSSIIAEERSSRNRNFTANMKVKVKMQQADMPGGLSNLLFLTTNNMPIEETIINLDQDE